VEIPSFDFDPPFRRGASSSSSDSSDNDNFDDVFEGFSTPFVTPFAVTTPVPFAVPFSRLKGLFSGVYRPLIPLFVLVGTLSNFIGLSRRVFKVVDASAVLVIVCKLVEALLCSANEGMICVIREGDVKTSGFCTSRLENATAFETRDTKAWTVSGSRMYSPSLDLLKVVVHMSAAVVINEKCVNSFYDGSLDCN
jgi:hypothetical protein